MNELRFRGKDRYRPSWPYFALVCLVLVAGGIRLYARYGPPFLWMCFVLLALAGLGILVQFRSWTAVGAAGISINRGIGRSRTYPWQEILWVEAHQLSRRSGSSVVARITLVDGRRLSLPALRHSHMYPQPTFAADFQRVVDWWIANTDPDAQFQPSTRVRHRLMPALQALLVVLLAGGVFALVFALQS